MPRKKATKRRKPTSRSRAKVLAKAMFDRALKGEVWAFRAITDATEGTISGEPPPIDQNAIYEENPNISVAEFLRRVREKYEPLCR